MAAIQAHQRLFLASTCAGQRLRPRPSRIAAPCRAAVSGGVRTAQSPSSSSGSGSPSSMSLNLDWIAAVPAKEDVSGAAAVELEKLRAIAEAAADRAEMHDIIGRQRDNWNHLLLHSNNSLLLAASVMAALAPAAPTVVALKASAGVLLASAAVTMAALGMVFELLRNCAGFYRKMQEEIEANLGEADVERREDGEVFETKVALQLGRSTSELKQFRRMASPAVKDDDVKDFAGKLF
uniref:Uncharacterized protein n=1 Tax=Oryza rufipogon TaxID=4529 RepID=A0A0E0NBY9_ORYRU